MKFKPENLHQSASRLRAPLSFYFLWKPPIYFSVRIWFSPLSIQIGAEVWGLLRADLPGERYLIPLPQLTKDLLYLWPKAFSRTQHENSRRYLWDACIEIQVWAEYHHYLNYIVLEFIILCKLNLLKITFMPFMLMVDEYSMKSWVTEVGLLISHKERCGPNCQDASSELYWFIFWTIFLPFCLKKKNHRITYIASSRLLLRCHLLWFKTLQLCHLNQLNLFSKIPHSHPGVVFWSDIKNYFKHLQGLGLFIRANNALHGVYRSLQCKLESSLFVIKLHTDLQ